VVSDFTVSVQLASGFIIHDCKILEQDGSLLAQLPQRSERLKGGQVIYHDLLEFADPQTWASLAPKLVTYYQAHAPEHS
jgi:DNA-binding cell septation regulator SpoVG